MFSHTQKKKKESFLVFYWDFGSHCVFSQWASSKGSRFKSAIISNSSLWIDQWTFLFNFKKTKTWVDCGLTFLIAKISLKYNDENKDLTEMYFKLMAKKNWVQVSLIWWWEKTNLYFIELKGLVKRNGDFNWWGF